MPGNVGAAFPSGSQLDASAYYSPMGYGGNTNGDAAYGFDTGNTFEGDSLDMTDRSSGSLGGLTSSGFANPAFDVQARCIADTPLQAPPPTQRYEGVLVAVSPQTLYLKTGHTVMSFGATDTRGLRPGDRVLVHAVDHGPRYLPVATRVEPLSQNPRP
ncbi:MAG: hypothetical protein ACYCW6_16630 [Candidatus Xenobia bacterium]